MSVGSGGLGTVYSRLPQSTSDVETSEDEVSQHENLIFYRKMGTPKKGNVKQKEENSTTTMKDYQPLGHEGGPIESHEVHINGFSNINYSYPHGTGGPVGEEETMVLGTLGGGPGTSAKKEGEGRHGNLQMLAGNRHPMSMMRQVAFVMSLCLCIFVIVAFLWVLPCNWSSCPIMQYDKQGGSSWERTLHRLELIGGISVVPSGNEQHNNLLFMIRGEINIPDRDKEQETTVFTNPIRFATRKEEPTPIPATGGGLVALMGSTGTVVWYKTLHSVPRDMDCSLIDLDADGKTDCLLIGSNDLMYAFNPVSPTTIWFLHAEKETDYIPSDMEFPLILPDIDEDGILDLAVACRMLKREATNTSDKAPLISSKTSHNHIAMVSGKTGKLMGKAYVDGACQTVYKLAVDKDLFITYRCVDYKGKESVKGIALNILYRNITGNHLTVASLDRIHLSGPTLKQHIFSQNYGPPDPVLGNGEPQLQNNKPSTFSVRGKKLTILNTGHCPDDCTASARVFDEKRGLNNSIWSDGGNKMYALRPAILLFNSQLSAAGNERSERPSSDFSLGPVSGFAVKFWHWTSCEKSSIWSTQRKQLKRMTREKDWSGTLQPNDHWHDGTSQQKSPEYIESRESRIGSSGINTTTKSLSRNASTVTVTYHPKEVYSTFCLKERIVLVTFNDTDMHLVNASESEIKQLCSNAGCQPSLAYQEQSLIIADLDGDGSKELVSYLTTYETEEDGKPQGSDRLILVSKVRVVRLEAELPKLYEAVTHL
ncbi:Protein FAM234A [Frankliniella fusca]|uniref:Protein FAM234A n=1 Tax=Frankliniella fusca TaxID=407009 RepID=A0AAE1H1P4_9NEOP|nr:Protein FAM234A [Frankliniella fusca]